MKQLVGSLLLVFVAVVACMAQESPVGSSTITFGVGGAKPFASYSGGGPSFNGTYEYRLRRHWALEFGVDTALVNAPISTISILYPNPSGTVFTSPTYIYTYENSTARLTIVPFGPRWVLPLYNGRVELAVGAGGSHVWAPSAFGSNANFWGLQGNLSARIAVDKQRHFWVGGTGRYTHDVSSSPLQWSTWTADFAFRFK